MHPFHLQPPQFLCLALCCHISPLSQERDALSGTQRSCSTTAPEMSRSFITTTNLLITITVCWAYTWHLHRPAWACSCHSRNAAGNWAQDSQRSRELDCFCHWFYYILIHNEIHFWCHEEFFSCIGSINIYWWLLLIVLFLTIKQCY